jgi:FAD synthase
MNIAHFLIGEIMMIQELCNERGTVVTLVDAIQDASIVDLERLRAAICKGDTQEVGRLLILFYEDYTYKTFSDAVLEALE